MSRGADIGQNWTNRSFEPIAVKVVLLGLVNFNDAAKVTIEHIAGDDRMKVAVNGANAIEAVPGLRRIAREIDIVLATDRDQLAKALPDADVLLGWNFQSQDMQDQWDKAKSLKWIHWCGAAVDRVMSPELAASDILLTNARGLFDDVMAEYILAYMLAESMRLRETFELQGQRLWKTRTMSKLAGTTAVIFGVGSIGRTTPDFPDAFRRPRDLPYARSTLARPLPSIATL